MSYDARSHLTTETFLYKLTIGTIWNCSFYPKKQSVSIEFLTEFFLRVWSDLVMWLFSQNNNAITCHILIAVRHTNYRRFFVWKSFKNSSTEKQFFFSLFVSLFVFYWECMELLRFFRLNNTININKYLLITIYNFYFNIFKVFLKQKKNTKNIKNTCSLNL